MEKSEKDFNFPFPPYKIQHDFMVALYDVIEQGQIGIFESPTGTGKTLSLLCGALTWLADHEKRIKEDLEQTLANLKLKIDEEERKQITSGNWIDSQYATIQLKDDLMSQKKILDLLLQYEKEIENMRVRKTEKSKWKKNRQKEVSGEQKVNSREEESKTDEDYCLDDALTDEEEPQDENDHSEEKHKSTKIFFCSRTHSQLSQVIEEIRKTKFGESLRVISLASRQNFCINDEVRMLKSSAMINEKCLDLQRSRSKMTSMDEEGKILKRKLAKGCEFLKEKTTESLKEIALTEVVDIEDLVELGKMEKACPYYSMRAAVTDAQLILLPYQMIFHKRTRDQSGIDLRDSVIIVDEAHNLLETISSIYCAEVDLDQLREAHAQISSYKDRYVKRFSTKNLLKLNQLIFVTSRLIKVITEAPKNTTRIIQTHELMSEGDFFNINLYELLQFAENTRLAQKIQGFTVNCSGNLAPKEEQKSATQALLEKLESGQMKKKGQKKSKSTAEEIPPMESESEKKNSPSVVRPLLAFLECLTENISDGRILFCHEPKPRMKYLLLKPEEHFADILKESRALIIAGGTMQPTNELTEQLFSGQISRLREYFFDHVVSADSVLPLIVSKGPNGKPVRFNFTTRSSPEILSSLGMTLQNLCNVIPAGIVVFFGSYDYLDTVYRHLENTKVLEKINLRKKIFREPRQGGVRIEKILSEYSASARAGSGAVMFSVVGGKLSEGLNFSDDLGRCVVIVGLPYPNRMNPELIEKMKHCDSILRPGAGEDYYENLCMKAVNQCIGRAVRHINDYASVILFDDRYCHERIRRKLPGWIRRSLKEAQSFGNVQSFLVNFFRGKRKTL
ncbi:DNA helicase [Sergentomyia squamirostris]